MSIDMSRKTNLDRYERNKLSGATIHLKEFFDKNCGECKADESKCGDCAFIVLMNYSADTKNVV